MNRKKEAKLLLKQRDNKDVNETQYVRHFLQNIGLSVVKKHVRVAEFDELPANHATMICSCATVSGTVKCRRTLSFLVHGRKAYSAFLQYYAQATQEYVYWVCLRVTQVHGYPNLVLVHSYQFGYYTPR